MTLTRKTTNQMTKNNQLVLILLAAGSSTRMGDGKKKEYLKMGSGTVLSTSLGAFFEYEKESGNRIQNIIVTVPNGQEATATEAISMDPRFSGGSIFERISIIEGGKTRQESVLKALEKACTLVADSEAVVLIHDSARPNVTFQIIQDVVDATIKYGAAVPAIPPVDTLKDTSGSDTITNHLVRKNLAAVQTPQGFHLSPLLRCHKEAAAVNREYTDDSEIWDAYPAFTADRRVHITKGDVINKKITYREDIPGMENNMLRIGFGTDLHRLVEDRRFMLGGIQIPSGKGELGHSDGDVLLHAISDALLGASGLGDIGSYFPPEEPKWKDADSRELLQVIWNDVKSKGWDLENMDCVLEFEAPKFLPWRKKVIDSIASILQVDSERVFVKAKTNEKLDSIGEGNAVKAYCTCLLKKR